jgi:hypothetical protein
MEAGLGKPDERLAHFVKALSEPDIATCAACISQLDGYIAAQLSGQDYQARFPDVAVHLDACLDCAGAYARQYELALAEATDRLPHPDHLPRPNLSFLRPSTTDPLTPGAAHTSLSAQAVTERLRTAVRRVGNRLTLQLSADLVSLLRPMSPTPALRAPDDAERYREVLLTLDPHEPSHPEMPFGLSAYLDTHQPERCLVEVTVVPPDREWPDLGGIRVALIAAAETRETRTDAWGLASFEDVPVARLADLSIEIDL